MSLQICRWLLYGTLSAAIIGSLLVWQLEPEPPSFLEVEIVNASGEAIASVEIHHGNADTEEKITLFQLEPKASRKLVLNHEPGLGYNLTARFADGRELSICGGRAKDHWRLREIITPKAIYSGVAAD